MVTETTDRYDLLLTGARVLDPRHGLDAVCDLALRGGRIAALGAQLPRSNAASLRDLSGALIVPGLIDLHTHIYYKATSYGVDPDAVALRSLVTTMVDAGSSGAGNFEGLRDFVMAGARTRLLAFLNISFPGIFAFDRAVMVGEAANRTLLSVERCRAVAEQNPDSIVGIKVRLGGAVSGDVGLEALDLAIEAAAPLGLPVMTHIGRPEPGYAEILARLRPGDVLTHCFRPQPNAPVDAAGQVLPALRDARARGVLFDIGHGMGAFGFESTEAALADGFAPDIISSDVHGLSVNGPAYDLLHTMNKLLNCGVVLEDLIRMVTEAPARALRREDLGHLGVGATADLSVLRMAEVPLTFVDVLGVRREGVRLLRPLGMVRSGNWHDPAPRPWEEVAT
ncbi:MAG: amidohydrolase/deacetylase family metallohydrolase [Burkholderiaceae bacterium]